MRHIIDAGEAIAQFMEGRVRADLDTDRMLLFAVIRAIEVIGEAAAKISEETRSKAQKGQFDSVQLRYPDGSVVTIDKIIDAGKGPK